VADDLASDAEYVEACRAAAWADRPTSEVARYWCSDERRFHWPDGWPEGVDPRASVQARIDASRPHRADDNPPASGPASPSVQRLREMLR
jgi:hypothetical protein